jgi:hypothetical protein
MPETLLVLAAVLAGSIGLAAAAIRIGIVLGGQLAKRVDHDPEEDDGHGPAS